jgi:hypothetical protein
METKEKKPKVKKDTWEIKDRHYHLLNDASPLTFRINSRHSMRKPLMYFDEEKGYNRELRYATNMKSPFVDEQEGPVTLGHIVFQDGVLTVPKSEVALQKMLSLYHPNRNKLYAEKDDVQEAVDELDYLEIEIAKILSLSQDQRTFSWASNNRKLMNVPFDENPYSALAAWFKTDEGVEVYKSIEKKFK